MSRPRVCRFFTRVAGWGPGQLESECAAGVWFTAAASAELVLNSGRDGAELWHKARMQRLPQNVCCVGRCLEAPAEVGA